MSRKFKALIVEEKADGSFTRNIKERPLKSLPKNDVLIKVHYSALNYKDALSATGNKGVTRKYPHTPGIDAAGMVVQSDDKRFTTGDKVLVTGYDLGMNTPGGFGEYIRVPGDWVVPLPQNMNLKESMMIGTAGFTAAFGVYKIIGNELGKASPSNRSHNISSDSFPPSKGDALVTGATGGVASLAISILNKNGFKVSAATGKTMQSDYLQSIGAAEVIDRNEVYQESNKPLLAGRWDVAVETVGGAMLDAVLRQIRQNGTVACCGNILGGDLGTSIYPFILRGVNLMGINSATCPRTIREKLWQLLADEWKPESLSTICRECTLNELNKEIDKILAGEQIGKVLVVHKP